MPRHLPIALFLVLAGTSAWAQRSQGPADAPSKQEIEHPGFARHAIALQYEFEALSLADLTGDGRRDLVIVESERLSREPVRFVSVFLQSIGGFRRAGEPHPLPPGVSLVSAGRFGGAPGVALLLPDSAAIWPWAGGRFQPEQATTYSVRSVFPVPAGEIVQDLDWVRDLNGDGSDELIVPSFGGLTALTSGAERRVRELGWMPVRPRSRYWRGLTYNAVAHDVPTLFYQDLDGDGWQDVIAFSDDELWVYPLRGEASGPEPGPTPIAPWRVHDLAPPKAFDPKAPYDPPMRLVRAGDLNGDGTLDLVLSKNAPTDSDFNARSTTLVFLGRKGGGTPVAAFPERPDQVYPSEGFSLPIVLDYNHNGKLDLIQVNVEVTFWNAMRAIVTRSVKAEAAFYLMDENGRYPASPTELEGYKVNFSLSRFGHQPIATWGDFDGDGLPDLLLSSAKEELGIHWGRSGEIWDPRPSVILRDRIPIHQRRVQLADLNGDGKHDIVLTYNRDDNRQMLDTLRRLTVLISQHARNPP